MVPSRSGVPFALFRILFGTCLAIDAGELLRDAAFWFGEGAWPGLLPARILLGLWIVAALALAAGARARVSAVVCYGMCVLFLGFRGMPLGYEYHLDGLYLMTTLGLVFLPASARLSVDALREGPRPVGRAPFVFLACVASSIYLDSALWKLSSELWRNGLGYWLPAIQPTDAVLSIAFTQETRWLALGLSHVTLAYELLFPVLIWFRRVRLPLLLIGFGLHVGVATIIPLPLFGLLMCAILVGLLPAGEGRQVHGRERRWSRRPVTLARAPGLALLAAAALAFVTCLAEPVAALGPGRDRVLPAPLARLHELGLVWSYRLLGVRSHPIFLDSAFADYTEDRRLAFVPAGADAGQRLGPPQRNRHYVQWHYRTVWPLLDRSEMEPKLARFVRFHLPRAGLDLTRGTVELQVRPTHLPVDGWAPGMRARNVDEPWVTEATISLDGSGGLRFHWRGDPEGDG